MRSVFAAAGCMLLVLLLATSSPARADVFGPLELASTSAVPGTTHVQAGQAIYPVISGDGRYLAFVGSFEGVPGIWRRDLETGAVALVAPGDATLPSISANGRYISFTTTERLVAGDTNISPDVYVRDMEAGEGEAEYKLVSAVNGSEEAPTYTFSGLLQVGHEEEFGAVAGARSAISESGEEVVFVTTAASNLLGGGEPTPELEVLVRNLLSEETRLVSVEFNAAAGRPANGEDQPVEPQTEGASEFGAAFIGPNAGKFSQFHPNRFPGSQGQGAWIGASISADGSTVAWMGQDLEQQTELLPGEQTARHPQFAEPLWRRIGDGPAAPVRRITGGSDPLSPGCAGSGELVSQPSLEDPCAGPFEHYLEDPEGLWGMKVSADFVPQLSRSGGTVAFITGAHDLGAGVAQFQGAETTDDLYLVDMASGLTRVQALHRLTAIGGGGFGTQEHIAKSAAIVDYTVSPDGSQVAFTTQRTEFAFGPTFVSATAAAPGMIELFDADFANETLTRVSHGFEGENVRSEELPAREIPGTDPYEEQQGAYAPSFSADGNTLSFASTANNLVFGDGNNAADVFTVHRVVPTVERVPQFVSLPPASPTIAVPWKLTARAVSLADGRVLLDVDVPAAGTVAAAADGAVRVRSVAARSARHHARTSGKTVAQRLVASGHTKVLPADEGLVTLKLALTPTYRSLATGGGLSVNVKLTFVAPGRPALHASLPARFLRARSTAKPKSHTARRPAAKKRRTR